MQPRLSLPVKKSLVEFKANQQLQQYSKPCNQLTLYKGIFLVLWLQLIEFCSLEFQIIVTISNEFKTFKASKLWTGKQAILNFFMHKPNEREKDKHINTF